MGLNLLGERSVKNEIIILLSEDWPLTAKKIFYILKKRLKKSVSYQAVFKALNELVKQKILVKDKYVYSINDEWIKKMSGFFDNLSLSCRAEPQNFVSLIFKKKSFSTKSPTYYDFLSGFLEILSKFHFVAKKDDFCVFGECRHIYWPFGFGDKDLQKLRDGLKNYKKVYILCRSNSTVDHTLYKFFKKINPNIFVLFGQSVAKENDLIIGGDLFGQVFFSKNLSLKLDKFYKEYHRKNLDQEYPLLFQKIGKITGFISWDKDFAETKKQEILEKFQKAGLA